jgi:multiple sugar transport system permease protein
MSRDRPNSVEEVRDAAELLGYRLVSARRSHRRRPRLRREKPQSPRRRSRAGYLFVGGYAALLGVVGIWPAGYALNLALTTVDGAFSGLANFTGSYNQGFLIPAFEHVGEFMLVWLTTLIVMVIGLSLLMHTLARRVSAAFRFVFYVPAAFAGSASVLLWLFMLQPGLSPWDFVLRALGYKTLGDSLIPGNLPIIYALIAFWTGAGSWILVIHGALANIPDEVLEAAALDGAGPLQTAMRIKLPMIKKWVIYMLIVAFAGGTQLFAEPQLVSVANLGLVSPVWSPNTLATYLAFQYNNFNWAAAISIDLLVVALVGAGVLVFRTRLFKAD